MILNNLLTFIPMILGANTLKIFDGNEIKMITDVLRSLDKPSNVMANLCWKPMKKKQLMTNLIQDGHPKSIKFINAINADTEFAQQIIYLINAECPAAMDFLSQANTSKRFIKPFRWFILSGNASKSSIFLQLDKLNILPDSEVLLSQHVENGSYILHMVYKFKFDMKIVAEYYGIWTADHGVSKCKDMERSAAMRRKNFQKEPIVISVVSKKTTKEDLLELRNSKIDPVSQSGFRQMMPLYDFLNATVAINFTDNFGYYVNGSWIGVIRNMIHGDTELAGSVMFVTLQRSTVLEYLSYPTELGLKFLFREPPLSYQNNLYLLPFKATVWYCIAGFVVILIFVLYINAHWEVKKYGSENGNKSMSTPNISDIAVLVISAISQQGSSFQLKGTLGRLVTFILFLMFLFLYTSYSASIVVLLQSSSDQIKTLQDLLNSKLELGAEDTIYNRHYFSTETEPVRKAIYDKKIAPKGSKANFFPLKEGILQLREKPFAFHVNVGAAFKVMEKYFYDHEKCGLHEINYLPNHKLALSCRRTSSYKEIFKIGSFRNVEHGLSNRENRLIYSKRPQCSVHGGSFASVNLIDCYPPLLMLLYGMILSFALLLVEILHHRLITMKTQKQRNFL